MARIKITKAQRNALQLMRTGTRRALYGTKTRAPATVREPAVINHHTADALVRAGLAVLRHPMSGPREVWITDAGRAALSDYEARENQSLADAMNRTVGCKLFRGAR